MTRVLIVDDQPNFRRQLRALLERAGLEVAAEADSIAEAEALAQSLQPDLAVVDVLMPGLSGIEGTPRLKLLAPRMRVILVSAYHDRLLLASAKAAGAEAFIPKDELDMSVALSWNRNEEKQDET
ncbi:MAG: response regulator transcription factor [Anaerolineae bacterium]|nr:response regulator transcription factor [Anaerolineae bacterium]